MGLWKSVKLTIISTNKEFVICESKLTFEATWLIGFGSQKRKWGQYFPYFCGLFKFQYIILANVNKIEMLSRVL